MDSAAWIPVVFVAVIVLVTIGMGIWAARVSHTASDFFVAGRSVSAFWNASAISGEYLSAASFMGVAGMVMKNGYDTLWYPVGYATGYLFLHARAPAAPTANRRKSARARRDRSGARRRETSAA